MKEVLDDLRVIKSDFVHEINERMETIYGLRSKVDRIVSERSFLHRRGENEQLAFEATKGSYHDQLDRNGIYGHGRPRIDEYFWAFLKSTVRGFLVGTKSF